jgi:CDP-glucose 4,6-dehydratase
LTGHTGFKGGWLSIWLKRLGAQVTGLAQPPLTDPNLFELARVGELTDSYFCDVRSKEAVSALIRRTQPEIILHLAAQPLVRPSYRDPVNTFLTNIMGTVHVLDSLRGLNSARVAVMVTTDKVYQNHESNHRYKEDDALGGDDPYSASKAGAELAVASYRDSFLAQQKIAVGTARAGNVIGGGDWSEDRLIPDAVKAWLAGKALHVRRPASTRPWQHVLEPLTGYLVLAERLWEDPTLSGAWNFGPPPQNFSVRQVVEMATAAFGGGEVIWGGESIEGPVESNTLALESAKAHCFLGVASRWSLQEGVKRSIDWYSRVARGQDPRALCEADIADYAGSS